MNFNTTRIVGLVILAAGVILLILGLTAAGSTAEDVRQEVTGAYSQRTTWYIVAGIAGLILGGGLLVFGSRASSTRSMGSKRSDDLGTPVNPY